MDDDVRALRGPRHAATVADIADQVPDVGVSPPCARLRLLQFVPRVDANRDARPAGHCFADERGAEGPCAPGEQDGGVGEIQRVLSCPSVGPDWCSVGRDATWARVPFAMLLGWR